MATPVGRWLDSVPNPLRARFARSLRARPGLYEAFSRGANRGLPARLRIRNPGTKTGLLGQMLRASFVDARYLLLVSRWLEPEAIVLQSREPETGLSDFAHRLFRSGADPQDVERPRCGARARAYRLLDVLMFQAWLEEQSRPSREPQVACAYA